MNEEKNNIGINNTGGSNGNSLPPMGTAQLNTNNVHDKYGLPPISNFTNFNVNYEPPKVDNNISVFDLGTRDKSIIVKGYKVLLIILVSMKHKSI